MSKEIKLKPVAEKKFSIFKISEDGLLKTPQSIWRGAVFGFENYYDSEEAAMQAIQKVQYLSDSLIIMPVIRWNHFPE